MYNQPSTLQNLWQNTSLLQKIIILIIPFIIVMIIVVTIISFIFNQKDNNIIQITNFSEYSTAPTEYKKSIENDLLSTLRNNNTISLDTTDIPATIRQDSYSESTYDNVTTADFIVDIPSYEQSYHIEFSYSQTQKVSQSNEPNDYTVNITCPSYTELIYNKPCLASTNIIDDLAIYLPYSNSNTTVPYTLKIATYNSGSSYAGQKYLSAIIYSCNNEQLLQKGKEEIADWITIRKYNISDFPIEYTQACSQE